MRSAVVVGAGLAGLAAAGALARAGWKVTLLERDDRLRPGKAAVVLWPNGVRALRALGLAGGLDGIATPVPPSGVRRPDGTWLVQPGVSELESPPVVIHGEDLHDALISVLGEQVDVRGGVEVQSARVRRDRPAVGDGRVMFEADLVVAADGPDSAIRRRLAAATTFASAGFAAWRAVIPWFRAPEVPSHGETIGAGQRFEYHAMGESRGISWVATVPGAPRPEPPAGQLALLRRWFDGWHAPVGELLAATEAADLVQEPVGELAPLPEAFGVPCGPGGYVLVGEAAHAMPHHLSQGASLALEDVATLQAVIAQPAIGPALVEYTRLRRPRIVKVLQQSKKAAAVLQPRSRLASSLARVGPRTLDRAAAASTEWAGPTG